MNLVDYIILTIILLCSFFGFKKGFLPTIVVFVGSLAIIILAFYFKNPVSLVLYQYLPFIGFGGNFTGISVFNVLLFEGLAILITIIILSIILGFVAKITGLIEKILTSTIVLGPPSKILGAIVGFFQGYVIAFIVVFIMMITGWLSSHVKESQMAPFLIEKTPILSNIVSDSYNSIMEVINIATRHSGGDRHKANLEALEVLLEHKIISPTAVDRLIEQRKISTPGATEVVDRFR